MNGLEWFKQGIEEELNLVLFELDPGCFEFLNITLEGAVIGVGRDDVDEVVFLNGFDNPGEGVFGFVELEDDRIDVSFFVCFNSDKSCFPTDS